MNYYQYLITIKFCRRKTSTVIWQSNVQQGLFGQFSQGASTTIMAERRKLAEFSFANCCFRHTSTLVSSLIWLLILFISQYFYRNFFILVSGYPQSTKVRYGLHTPQLPQTPLMDHTEYAIVIAGIRTSIRKHF